MDTTFLRSRGRSGACPMISFEVNDYMLGFLKDEKISDLK